MANGLLCILLGEIMIERLFRKKYIIAILMGLTVCGLFMVIYKWRSFEDKEDTVTSHTVELTLVYAYQNAQWHQGIETIVDAFNSQNDTVKITTQVQYEDKVYEDILAKLQARDSMGDIIQLKVPERYAQEGLIVPLGDDLGEILKSSYYYNDQLYGVEAIGSTCGILYNKDIFEKYNLSEPVDYGEFLDICNTLKTCGTTPIGVAGSELWHMEFWVNHFFRTDILAQNDAWLVNRQDGTVHWNDDAPMQMLTHLQQLFFSGYVNEDWLTTQDGNLAYSMSLGEVAMIYTGSWTAKEIQKLNPDMKLGWFYLPDESGTVIIPQNKDVYWSVTKSCGDDNEKYEAAMTFLEYFYNDEVYSGLCENTYGFPVTKEKIDYNETEIQKEIKQKFCTEQLHITDYVGNENTPQGFEKALLHIVQDMAIGNVDAEAAAQQLDELWDFYQMQEK